MSKTSKADKLIPWILAAGFIVFMLGKSHIVTTKKDPE